MRIRAPIVAGLTGLAVTLGVATAIADEKTQPPPAVGSKESDANAAAIRKKIADARAAKEAAAKQAAAPPAEAKTAGADSKDSKAAEDNPGKGDTKSADAKDKEKDKVAKKIDKLDEKKDKIDEKIAELVAEKRKSRDRRKKARQLRVYAKWRGLVTVPAAKTELRRHARRMAWLNRMKELAEEGEKEKLLARIDKLIEKETERHETRLDKLKADNPGKALGHTGAPPGHGGDEAPGKAVSAAAKAGEGTRPASAARNEGKEKE